MQLFFFFNDTATTEIYTLSLHDALPICRRRPRVTGAGDHAASGQSGRGRAVPRSARAVAAADRSGTVQRRRSGEQDRKSTRLNSSHANISYAVFCLKKKKTSEIQSRQSL